MDFIKKIMNGPLDGVVAHDFELQTNYLVCRK